METFKKEFLEIYQKIHIPFNRYCRSKTIGIMSAEDLMQEAILRALEHYAKINDPKKLNSYLISIVNNLVRNEARKNKFKGTWNESVYQNLISNDIAPETALDIEYLFQCIHQLNPKDKEIILLFDISGFSIKEIAEIQQSSISATKTRLHRARKQLKVLAKDSEQSMIQKLQTISAIFL
ncbi:MAG: RNA polymerase sigma factor [Bacteroidota bacterium]